MSHAYVPVAVAALLREYPTLVGPAVHAFTNKDYCDNKVSEARSSYLLFFIYYSY